MSLGRWFSIGGSGLYGQMLPVRPEGLASSQQARLYPLVAAGFWHFLGCCKSEWRLGLITVGTVDLLAEQRLKPIAYRTFWPKKLSSVC